MKLRTPDEIAAAGAAAVADWPPLTEVAVTELAKTLAPLRDDSRWERVDDAPATTRKAA